MEIYVDSDHNLDGGDKLIRHAESQIAASLSRLADHITRVDVHLADESSGRNTPGDKRCTLEACPAGQPPVAVTDNQDTLDAALTGAIHKLRRLLETKFDRIESRDARDSIRGRA